MTISNPFLFELWRWQASGDVGCRGQGCHESNGIREIEV